MENEIGETARLNSEKMVIKSKMLIKNSVLSTKKLEQKRKGSTKKQKNYPDQEEEILTAPDDFPEGLKYYTKQHKSSNVKK